MPTEDDGASYHTKIVKMIDDPLTENDFELQPERIKFKCLINNQHEEIVAYNDIIDYIEADQTGDKIWKFPCVLDHKHVKPSNKKEHVNKAGETAWQPLHHREMAGMHDCNSITIAIYACKNGLLNTKGWVLPGLPMLAKTQQCIICHTKQVKLQSFHTKPI